MLCIQNEHTDPFFNAATEEHFFRHYSEDCFLLYRNEPSIIVGKHQNTLAEINYDYVQKNRIKVVRRLSGGGTVYHDPGNLNFTFIQNGEAGKLIDFRKFTKPILEVLNRLSVPARFEGVNDLRVGDKKISGNAEHVFKNRVLHHGTLLFSSQLDVLNQAIKPETGVYQSNAVQSIRSVVANISDYLKEKMDILEFRDRLMIHILETFPGAKSYDYTDDDMQSIQNLVDDKYATWEWNYGYSPSYQLNKQVSLGEKTLSIEMRVERGIIKEISLKEKDSGKSLEILEKIITGCSHNQDELKNKLHSFNMTTLFPGINIFDFIIGLF